jgi:nickel transport protein
MIRLLLPLLLALAFIGPAQAHKLKVFATVEGGEVKGYAFFIGGGRAAQTAWVARDAAGAPFASGTTDGEGRFAFPAPQPPTDATVTVDTREGHVASMTLPASRFGGRAVAAAPALPTDGSTTIDPDARLAALVEAAVQRQVAPLLERIEQLDSRLRYADILSGIFLILGLAGIGLWARGRRG